MIDDDVLRVGSSNLNNRSLRLDTECDVVIDAVNAGTRVTIAGIRDGLLAEHLGSDGQTIAAMIARTGSIIETIEQLRGEGRSLRPYEVRDLDAVRIWLADNKILDPEGPGEMFEALSRRKPLLGHLRLHRPGHDGARWPASKAILAGAALAGGVVLASRLRKRR